MVIEVTAYRCKFHSSGCTYRTLLDKRGAERHEANCYANPDTRSCKTCVHDSRQGCMIGLRGMGNRIVKECESHRLPAAKPVLRLVTK